MYIEITLSKRNIILTFLVVLIGLGLGSVGGFYTYDFLRTDVFDGVYLQDLSLGRLTRDDVCTQLQDYLGPRLETPITFHTSEISQTYTADMLGFSFDYEKMAQDAVKVGRTGNWFAQRAVRRQASKQGFELQPQVEYDKVRFKQALSALCSKTELSPIPARWEVLLDGYQVKLIPSRAGRAVDIDQTGQMIMNLLRQAPPYELSVPFVAIQPRLDTEEAANLGITEVISSFRTSFNPANTSRVKNIRLAAQAIDGKILLPGEVLSFNRLTGPRLPESGYEEAPIIVNGELVPGVGGGVCQVSTTLYNAAVLANLSILERNRHTLPSAYVAPGRDATVYYDYLDLKLHNETVRPVVVQATVGNNYVDVKILGKWVYDWRVQIEVEELETIAPTWAEEVDTTLLPGQRVVEKEALAGRKVRVWKKYISPDGAINREVLSIDTYQPINGVVKVGR